MEKGRRAFDIFASTTLVLFAAFAVIHLFCAATLPDFRKPELQRLIDEGYAIVGETYDEPRFSSNDSTVTYQRTVRLKKGTVERSSRSPKSVPTGRTSQSRPAPGRGETTMAIRRLLLAAGLTDRLDAGLALSRDGRELVFTTPAPALVLRTATGSWRLLEGGALPPVCARLGSTAARPRPERLAAAGMEEWADALVEEVLASGPQPAPVVDRLIRVHRDPAGRTDELLEILIAMKTADLASQVARAIASIRDERLQERLLKQALDAEEAGDEGARRRALLSALIRREWGDTPTEFLKGLAVGALESGDVAGLDVADREALALKLKSYAGRSHAPRLARVVEIQEGAAADAAYATLRHLAAEPAPSTGVPPAREWLATLRQRFPDWFR